MEYIRKLPYILAALMTMIIGIVSYQQGAESTDIYIRMLLCLVTFLLIGMIIRSILGKLVEENQENEEITGEEGEESGTQGNTLQGSVIDLRVDDTSLQQEFEEEFTPLKVSQVIRTSLKEDERKQ